MAELDPREVRNNQLLLLQRVGLLEESDQKQNNMLSLLMMLVRGNSEVGHPGLVKQLGDISETVNSIKKTQEMAELERQRSKDRWKWIMLGMSFAAVPGIKEIVDILVKIFS